MTDTDPENEVGDVPRPADRMIQSPRADAGGNLVAETEQTEGRDPRGDRKRNPPPARRRVFDRARDAIGDPIEIALVQDQRDARKWRRDRSGGFAFDHVWCCGCAVHFSILCHPEAKTARDSHCVILSSVAVTVWGLASLRRLGMLRVITLLLPARDRDRAGIRHLRIRIANPRQVTRPRLHVQIFEQPVISVLRLDLRDARLRIADVAKNDRFRRASLRAGAREGIARDQRFVRRARAHVRGDLGFLDPLHAIGAFLHHAAHPHGDVRILLQLHRVRRAFLGQRPEIFLIDREPGDLFLADRALVVIEEIKAAHLERAVVRAIPRADAAVVGHDVEADPRCARSR